MADIIPGVPTPVSGDPKCVLSVCARIIAQVDCIVYILQGTTACIDIQLFGADGLPLDLRRFREIQVLLFDDLECTVANFWWPAVPTGCRGFVIEILQHENTAGDIVNEGLIRICLDSTCTGISPGNIFAELRLVEDKGVTGAPYEEMFGIRCLQVAVIQESKIFNNGCDQGCSLLT
jgi:hypothetical protein